MVKFQKFNINKFVKIKLNLKGEQIWDDYWKLYKIPTPTLVKDKDGYIKIQAWQMMEVFGKHIKLGFNLPFETEIYYEVIE